jgi:tetratricopeptide (TPR) repeat protein
MTVNIHTSVHCIVSFALRLSAPLSPYSVIVAALGSNVLQARIDSEPEVAVEIQIGASDELSESSALEVDRHFIAREEELVRIGSVVETVFTSIAPQPRDVLLIYGDSGLGKSAAAKQGLRLMQSRYAAASCCKDVHMPRVVRGRGAAAVQEDLVRWGCDLGSELGVSAVSQPDTVLPLLKSFLEHVRYVVLIDDADEAGLQEALKHLPPSQLPCALLITSQTLKRDDLQRLLSAAESSSARFQSSIDILDLQPLTADECTLLIQCLCPIISQAPLYAHRLALGAVYEELARLPLAVRFFGIWLRDKFQADVDLKRQNAETESTAFDEAASGAAVMNELLEEWCSTSRSIVLAAGAGHSRGLQATVRLALHSLSSDAWAAECNQLLALLAMCPSERTPWSLFDGGDVENAELMVRGRRVAVDVQSVGHVSIEGESCRIPTLKLDAVAISDELKDGLKVAVQLSNGKSMNVRSCDLLFEGDATAVEMDGQWMIPRRLNSKMKGQVMQQHPDGSVSVLFQGLHEGCHVRLQGSVSGTDANECFGHIYGKYDVVTKLWPVRVMLPSGKVKDKLLQADSLVCSGKVMALADDGSPRAVLAFASGWLSSHRPGATVMRFQGEDVKGARAEGMLEDVTDALGSVAAALESIGFVEVNEAERVFSMHRMLQRAVRAEVGGSQDGAMAALLQTRLGFVDDEAHFDPRSYGVIWEIAVAAAHVLDQIKAADPDRAAWVCSMRVRLLQLARYVINSKSLDVAALNDELDADLKALGADAERPVSEYRAVGWWRRCFSGSKVSFEALIREVEEAAGSAPDAVAGWDCSAALGHALFLAGNEMLCRVQYDPAIELFERALGTQIATLGEEHTDTARTICCIGVSHSKKGQQDRAMEYYEHALRIQMATLGEMHADTARTISSIGVSHSKKGQQDRAIEYYERALHIRMATLGEMHADTARTICSMGISYSKKGQEDWAMALFVHALRIQMATLGEMHADTARTICRMGESCSKKGQQDRAIELYDLALGIQMATLGEMHADTARTICSMGISYSKKGQEDWAIELFERSLSTQIATLGDEHTDTARTICCMGISHSKKGQQDLAMEYYEHALRIQMATLGEMHADTARTISSIGVSHSKKGQQDRAMEYYEHVLRIQMATLGEMHADTARTISSIGVSHSKKGQQDRAIEYYERALHIRMATLGEMHADTARTICSMGISYSKKGQEDWAMALFVHALRIQMATLGEMHADTARTISSIGVSHSKKGQQDRAIEYYERALHIRMATLGEMHADTARTMSSMGMSRSWNGQFNSAMSEAARALSICMETLGSSHPQTQGTLQTLANIRAAAAGSRAADVSAVALPRNPEGRSSSSADGLRRGDVRKM